jgi:hypothetical protein
MTTLAVSYDPDGGGSFGPDWQVRVALVEDSARPLVILEDFYLLGLDTVLAATVPALMRAFDECAAGEIRALLRGKGYRVGDVRPTDGEVHIEVDELTFEAVGKCFEVCGTFEVYGTAGAWEGLGYGPYLMWAAGSFAVPFDAYVDDRVEAGDPSDIRPLTATRADTNQ